MAVHAFRRRPFGEAPPPPMPTDPSTCRWCGGQKREILPADGEQPAIVLCNAGCASNVEAPYLADCRECGRPFHTGARRPTLCHECDGKDKAAHQAAHEPLPANTYHFSRFGRGGYRD